jgi:hypothetical protein
MSGCAKCAASSPLYDFGLVCCRVRFLIALPDVSMRKDWLAHWRAKGQVSVAETKAAYLVAVGG